MIGSATCAAVGWVDCTAPFEPDPTGWGCTTRIPTMACAGATRDAPGSDTCAPVGDCTAPFPPVDASYFVRASYTDGELDSRHYRTIADAIATAQAGATIAIDEGSYAEALVVDKSLTLWGRCADKVAIMPLVSDAPGVRLIGHDDVLVHGVSIQGHAVGIAAAGGSSLTVEDSVVDSNRWVGIGVTDAGTSATVRRSVIRGTTVAANGDAPAGLLATGGAHLDVSDTALVANEYANIVLYGDGASATVKGSVLRAAVPPSSGEVSGRGGFGAWVQSGALDVDGSVVVDNHAVAIDVEPAPGGGAPSAHVTNSVLAGTRFDAVFARGIYATGGAQVTVENATIGPNAEAELVAADAGTKVHLENVTLRGQIRSDEPDGGVGLFASDAAHVETISVADVSSRLGGVMVQRGAEVVADRTLVRDGRPSVQSSMDGGSTFGFGAVVLPTGTLSLTDSALVANREFGLFARGEGASVTGDRLLVEGTKPADDGNFGRAINVQDGAALSLTRSALRRCQDAALSAFYGAEVSVTDSAISHTTAASVQGLPTVGTDVALVGGAKLTLSGTTLSDASDLAFVVSASSAFISASVLSRSAIGVVAQDGSSLSVGTEPSDDPLTAVISPDTRFVGLKERIGSGSVPLPTPITSSP